MILFIFVNLLHFGIEHKIASFDTSQILLTLIELTLLSIVPTALQLLPNILDISGGNQKWLVVDLQLINGLIDKVVHYEISSLRHFYQIRVAVVP